jgi:hypothetical protein
MLHEQQETISMRSNVWELWHVLLVNIPRFYVRLFCATGVSSGLAFKSDLDLSVIVESGGFTRGGRASDFIFMP